MQREISITYRSLKAFTAAINMVYVSEYEKENELMAAGYRIENNRLYLYTKPYSDNPKMTAFPYPYDKAQIISFAWGWLQHQKPTESEYGGDGHSEIGFEVTTNGTDYQDDHQTTFVSITPKWIYYGK